MLLNEENFDNSVLQSSVPVMVDFWAPWCSPCNAMTPVINELESEGFKVGKVNIEENQELAQQYNVSAIPAFVFFKDGKVVHNLVGVKSKAQLVEVFNELS